MFFNFYQVLAIRAWTQKKRAGRHEFDFATYQSRQISAANAAGSRLARQAQSSATLLRLKSGAGLSAAAEPAAGLSPWPPVCFMAYAVFVEFCSKPRTQPITARFLVQISCSSRGTLLIDKIFDTGATQETTRFASRGSNGWASALSAGLTRFKI